MGRRAAMRAIMASGLICSSWDDYSRVPDSPQLTQGSPGVKKRRKARKAQKHARKRNR